MIIPMTVLFSLDVFIMKSLASTQLLSAKLRSSSKSQPQRSETSSQTLPISSTPTFVNFQRFSTPYPEVA